jgi:MFS family permease
MDTRPLRVVPFRRLWLSTAVTVVGSQLTAVAVPKQIYDITGSSGYVGLAGVFGLVPLLVFGLWGGAISDAMDRRTLLLLTNCGIAVTSILYWLQAAAHLNSVWVVLCLLAVQNGLFAINSSTRVAAITRLVPTELLTSASALGGTLFQVAAVFGPLLAGALIPVLGLPTLYLLDAIGLTATIWAVYKLPSIPPLAGASRKMGLGSVLEGIRYLRTRAVLLASYVADLIAMVVGLPRALLPEMAEHTFGDPPGGGIALGLLYAAMPIGGALAGLTSGWVARVKRHGVAVFVAITCWGLAMVGFGLSHTLWLAVVFFAIGGAADVISSVFRSTILQVASEDHMQGRMQGVFTVVVAGGPRLGDVTHGFTAVAVGTAAATAGGGVLVVVLIAVAMLALPAFWRYRMPETDYRRMAVDASNEETPGSSGSGA